MIHSILISVLASVFLTVFLSSCSSTEMMTESNVSSLTGGKSQSQLNIPYRSLDTSKDLTTIGFGSCSDQNYAQPIWSTIDKNNPELFIMMGDNIYASTPENRPIAVQYIRMNQIPEYKKLREKVPFLAIWDDHDYGQNDAGINNPDKEEARRVFLNYWGYLKQTLPKNQQALYHSRMIGSKNKKVQVILLDTRWDRSDLIKNPDYNPITNTEQPPKIFFPHTDQKVQLLSSEQWQWLEDELKKPAQLRLIVSSIQLIPDDHYFEKWGNFPNEKQRFFNLLKKYKIKNAVILSGDRHLSAIAKTDIKGHGSIYEITASSLNKPSRAKMPELDRTYVQGSFLQPNFGLIQIDWNRKTLMTKIIDEANKTQIEHSIKF